MITIKEDGNVYCQISDEITESNISRLVELQKNIFQNLNFKEIQMQIIRECVIVFGSLLQKGVSYKLSDFANIIADYYELEGKTLWVYEFLNNVADAE